LSLTQNERRHVISAGQSADYIQRFEYPFFCAGETITGASGFSENSLYIVLGDMEVYAPSIPPRLRGMTKRVMALSDKYSTALAPAPTDSARTQ